MMQRTDSRFCIFFICRMRFGCIQQSFAGDLQNYNNFTMLYAQLHVGKTTGNEKSAEIRCMHGKIFILSVLLLK